MILTWIFVNSGRSLVVTTLAHTAFDAAAFAVPAAAASEKIRAVLTLLLWVVVAILIVRYGVRLSRVPAADRAL